jgi:hypothetical protein
MHTLWIDAKVLYNLAASALGIRDHESGLLESGAFGPPRPAVSQGGFNPI